MVADLPKFWAVGLFFVSTVILVTLFLLPPETSEYWTREAGPIEDFGAVAFLAGAVAAIATASQSQGLTRMNFILWAALALIFFGEETSYLQHWLGYATPAWMEDMNAQGEVNLHNLNPLQGGSLMEDGISIETLLTAQNLFRIGFVAYFLVLPIAYFLSTHVRSLIKRLSIPVAGKNLLTAAWIPILLSISLIFAGGEPSPLAETRETIYGTTIGIFLITQWWENRKVRRPGFE